MSDIIIVLGNYLLDDGSLSLINRERCFHAYGLYLASESMLLLSGGVANEKAPHSEAQAMKNYFMELGVNEEFILTETKSKNTFENAKFCKEILRNMQWDKLVLVSSSYHINRGYFNPVKFFKKYSNLDVLPIPCFDSGIKQIKFSDKNKDTELLIYGSKKNMLAYANSNEKNYFAISKKGIQQINDKRTQFFDNTANINELIWHLKTIYNIGNVVVKRL